MMKNYMKEIMEAFQTRESRPGEAGVAVKEGSPPLRDTPSESPSGRAGPPDTAGALLSGCKC